MKKSFKKFIKRTTSKRKMLTPNNILAKLLQLFIMKINFMVDTQEH